MTADEGLSEDENRVILECLRAAALGTFFPDEEFHTLFGLEREEVSRIVDDWSKVNKTDRNVILAINNSMTNLLGYPHRCEDEWPDFISVPPEEVARIFEKWRGARDDKKKSEGRRYFDNLM